jgi:hypothetical protein
MRVRELIELLSVQDQEAEIILPAESDFNDYLEAGGIKIGYWNTRKLKFISDKPLTRRQKEIYKKAIYITYYL